MAKHPRSYIYLTSLLEGSECQGAATVWSDPGFFLCVKIYPTRIQVTWQDVTTQLYLGIFMEILQNEGIGIPSVRWLECY